MIRLCFGTFINVLAQCKRARITKKRITNTIIKTIDSESKYEVIRKDGENAADKDDARDRALNHLYKCTGDFSPQFSGVRELAPKADRKMVIQQFEENVIPLIDADKSAQAVLALFDIIQNDDTLDVNSGKNVKKFQNCAGGKAVKDFLNDTNYDLPEILASIFLYTVTAVKNTEGKEWLREISHEYSKYDAFFTEYVNKFRSSPSCDLSNHQEIPSIARCEELSAKEPERMYSCFSSVIEDFPIGEFLDDDQINMLPDYRIRDAATFWGRINAELDRECIAKPYQSIIAFIDALEDYIGFLMVYSERPDAFPDNFRFAVYSSEIEIKANNYRKRARDLLKVAISAVDKEHMDGRIIHPGEYSPPSALEKYRKRFEAM